MTRERLNFLHLTGYRRCIELMNGPRVSRFLKTQGSRAFHYWGEALGSKYRLPGIRNPTALPHRVKKRVCNGDTREQSPHAAQAGCAHAVSDHGLPDRLRRIDSS